MKDEVKCKNMSTRYIEDYDELHDNKNYSVAQFVLDLRKSGYRLTGIFHTAIEVTPDNSNYPKIVADSKFEDTLFDPQLYGSTPVGPHYNEIMEDIEIYSNVAEALSAIQRFVESHPTYFN